MCCAQKSFSSGAARDESIFGLIFSLPRHRARSRSYEKYTKGEEEKLLSFDNVFDEIEHDIRSAIKDLYEGDGTDPGVRRWPRTTPRCCGTLRRAAAARAELPPLAQLVQQAKRERSRAAVVTINQTIKRRKAELRLKIPDLQKAARKRKVRRRGPLSQRLRAAPLPLPRRAGCASPRAQPPPRARRSSPRLHTLRKAASAAPARPVREGGAPHGGGERRGAAPSS